VGGAARCTDAHSFLIRFTVAHSICIFCMHNFAKCVHFGWMCIRLCVQPCGLRFKRTTLTCWGSREPYTLKTVCHPRFVGVPSRQGGGQKIKFVRPIVSNTLATSKTACRWNFGLGKDLLCPLTLLGRLLVPGHITFELAVVRHGVAAQNGGAYLGYPPPTCDCNCCCCAGSH